jgi:hypothetical protein
MPVFEDLDAYGNSGPGWRAGRRLLALPIDPNLALCLCCHWIASGPDSAVRAAAHRDETSHAVLAGRLDG